MHWRRSVCFMRRKLEDSEAGNTKRRKTPLFASSFQNREIKSIDINPTRWNIYAPWSGCWKGADFRTEKRALRVIRWCMRVFLPNISKKGKSLANRKIGKKQKEILSSNYLFLKHYLSCLQRCALRARCPSRWRWRWARYFTSGVFTFFMRRRPRLNNCWRNLCKMQLFRRVLLSSWKNSKRSRNILRSWRQRWTVLKSTASSRLIRALWRLMRIRSLLPRQFLINSRSNFGSK